MYHIYGKHTCPYCKAAIQLLVEQGERYTYHHASDELMKKRGWKTVPQVFQGSTHIGGYDELNTKLKVHGPLQKITWWIKTLWYALTDRTLYRVRVGAREECKKK